MHDLKLSDFGEFSRAVFSFQLKESVILSSLKTEH